MDLQTAQLDEQFNSAPSTTNQNTSTSQKANPDKYYIRSTLNLAIFGCFWESLVP